MPLQQSETTPSLRIIGVGLEEQDYQIYKHAKIAKAESAQVNHAEQDSSFIEFVNSQKA